MKRLYRVCTRCVMDTSDPSIKFGALGYCNHCTDALKRMQRQLLPEPARKASLVALAERVKRSGSGKEFDCIIGVSGGVDSTTTAYMTKQLGLRPLAVHVDNGWNTELAVDNVRIVLDRLSIPLETYVIDWDEFRDIQVAFLKSGIPNCEIPTDHAITATLFNVAHREKLKYILSGSNLTTEVILPISWSYYNQDLRLLRAIHSRFGHVPLRSLPTISVFQYFYYVFGRGIKQIPFLNYIDYDKEYYKRFLHEQLGWRDYGGKHYESVWTRYFQGYYLPRKFGFDKRRAHLSSLICSEQLTRPEALEALAKPPYDETQLRLDHEFVCKKLGLSDEEMEVILQSTPRPVTDYPSHYLLFHRMRRYKDIFRAIATSP